MQREVKNKTVTYGLSALLLAVLFTALIYNFGVQPGIQPELSSLRTFESYDELKNFIKTGMSEGKNLAKDYAARTNVFGESPTFAFSTSEDASKAAPGYSTTNIQVAGVDEADFVKTDGKYLYVVSKNTIYILKAYPPEQAEILSTITLNETYGAQIYVNGDKLAVLSHRQFLYYFEERADITSFAPYPQTQETLIKVYNIADKTNPILTRTVTLNGTLSGSRMIDDYIYSVVYTPATQPSRNNETDFDVTLPVIYTENSVKAVQPTEVRYISVSDVYYYFTTIIAVNIIDDLQEPTYEPILAGTSSTMYVSQRNMYLTTPNTRLWILALDTDVPKEETMICRIKLDKEKVVFEAQGNVSGRVLNQFSMDEYNGFFRIATTTGWGQTSTNNMFVLDMSLNIVGTLSDIAPGERIESARFMGDRCYLVTFRQIDPFFVIDLGDPFNPAILGYLKIPGFSRYLHPYDESYIIGIGKQDNNVKLSLFDVTNVSAPIEAVPAFIVQGGWSDTTVLQDHKAFLFDKAKQLLALPVSVYYYFGDGTYYDKSYWQGEYIFNLNLTNGFVLRGNISHQNSTSPWDSNYHVTRALYIDDILYTISNKKVKMNSLEKLELIKAIELG